MISYQLDPTAERLKTYPPPFKGTWKTLPSHMLPDDVLQDSFNTTLLSGELRSRLGLLVYDSFNFSASVIGSFMFITVSNIKAPVVSLPTKVYTYLGGSYSDITGSATLTATDSSQVRMTSIQIGTSNYLIYTNNIDLPKYSQDLLPLQDIIPFSGTLPLLKDLCTSFQRIIGITPPYTLSWSDVINPSYLNFTNWPALNQAILSDTEDSLVAIRSLGTLGFAVYKEGNIFVGLAQSGPASQAFRIEHRGEYEGPGGVQAIVNVNGTHIYMTPTGRVGQFDGANHSWICDGLWPYLQSDLDITYASKIFGVYNYRTSEIYFWYPRVGHSGMCRGLVCINYPYPLAGIQGYSYFLGETLFDCSNGLSIRLFNNIASPLIFSTASTHKKTFILDSNTYTDNSLPFSCRFSTGLFRPEAKQDLAKPKAKGDIYRPSLELYASRDATRGVVNIAPLTSNMLETNGILDELEQIDLTSILPNEYIGFNSTGSFIGVHAEWQSTSKFSYKGCDVYGRVTV